MSPMFYSNDYTHTQQWQKERKKANTRNGLILPLLLELIASHLIV